MWYHISIFTEYIFTIISFLLGQIKILVTGQHISSVMCIVLLIVFLFKCRKNHNTSTKLQQYYCEILRKVPEGIHFFLYKNCSLFDIKTYHKRIIYCQGLDGHHLNADLACNCTTLDSVSYALHYYCPPLIHKILIFCVRQ